MPDEWLVATLPTEPGLCGRCRHALLNRTRRETTYLRCGRASWDERMPRYPRLPVVECPGFERDQHW
jgi:uncharacterized cupin superfamily protein